MLKALKICVLVLLLAGIAGFVLPNQIFQSAAQEELPIFVKEEPPEKVGRPFYVPDEIIVKFKPAVKKEDIDNFNRQKGTEEKYESPYARFKLLKIPKTKTIEETVEIYKKNPNVEYAEPNYYAYTSMVPSDPYYQYQWHFDNPVYGGIQMEQAWNISTGDPSVVVAVVDTGVAYENYPAPSHWHIDSYRAYGGSGNSWWCGLNNPAWVTEPGYGNGWKDYLQHSFDLTSATGTVTLTYQYRHDLEITRGVAYDKAYTEVSDNGGESWTTLKTYTGKSKVGSAVGWKAESLSLTTYKGKNILLRFRFNSDETYSDEDGYYDSDGAIFIDEIKITHGGGALFDDKVEQGADTWETTKYEKAPDLAGTNFWVNSDEIAGDGIDNDNNTYIDDINGWDFINSDAHPNDDEAHGTHVSGTIAQTTNNNLGVAGIAFNTTIMPVKVLDAAGSGTYQQVADGIYYAVNNGAKIISMSLGGSSPATVLEDAVAYAYNNGVTILAAAGNDNSSTLSYPAAYDLYCIAVGATRYDETKSYYSNYGPSLDIVAPGGDTRVDQNGDGKVDGVLQNTFGNTPVDWAYWFYQGTSMATPHVSGVAALILAQNPSFTPTQIRERLQTTAEDKGASGWDQYYGWGIVDAYRAVAPIAISITTDGLVEFGVKALGATVDSSGDVQTIKIDAGPANLNVKSTLFSDGTNSWTLGTVNSDNQVVWEYSKEGTIWNKFLAANTLYSFDSSVPQLGTRNLYLRITMPTETSSTNQYSSTVTIVATSP